MVDPLTCACGESMPRAADMDEHKARCLVHRVRGLLMGARMARALMGECRDPQDMARLVERCYRLLGRAFVDSVHLPDTARVREARARILHWQTEVKFSPDALPDGFEGAIDEVLATFVAEWVEVGKWVRQRSCLDSPES